MRLDPFFDYERMPEALALAYQKKVRRLRAVDAELAAEERPLDEIRRLIGESAELVSSLNHMIGRVRTTCLVVPVLVHTADEPQWEDHPHGDEEDHQHLFQRCERCKSVLIEFCPSGTLVLMESGPQRLDDESDIPWVEKGQRVTKPPQEEAGAVHALPEDRELGDYEYECVGFEAE